ncbi:MAG: glycosyltransferase family 4 protein [Pyrinomonadaceae bacterium]
MRILQINSADTFGGGERHFVDLSNALAARGHEVFAALRPASPVRARLNLPDANVFMLPLRNSLDVASASELARCAREREVEIIHAHMARDYPPAAFAARRAPRSRLVLTRHVPFALNSLHRFALANVARVIAVSEGVARKLREQRIFPAERITVVPNGLDFAAYDLALRDFDGSAYRRSSLQTTARWLVGTVGELSETKGQEDFVRAAAVVARRGLDVEFLIVGEDKAPGEPTRGRIEQLIDAEHLRGRVHLRGYTPDLPRLLAALDVYVSASRAEAFGLATLEAMICGAAVVATATDGSREIIGGGAEGRLVPVGDAEALAAALIELLEDEDGRARLSANARASVRERFSLERMVAATEEVYRSALTGKDER